MGKQNFRVNITFEIDTTDRATDQPPEYIKGLLYEKIDRLGFGGNLVWHLNLETININVQKVK